MEPFENVNFKFYTEELKRDAIPTPSDFDRLSIAEKLRMQDLLDAELVEEKRPNGIDSTVCLWIEESYKAETMESGEAASFNSSESIGSYSHQLNTAAVDAYLQKNSKSTAAKKLEWLRLYCYFYNGF